MLADYYGRSALAAAQVLAGFDEAWFRSRLEATPVGISLGAETEKGEGRLLTDLLVRLAARLYPTLALVGEPAIVASMTGLAKSINPAIDIVDAAALGVAVGAGPSFETTIFAGCDGWDALISPSEPQPLGQTENSFGAGVAACLAATALFRTLFLQEEGAAVSGSRFSAFAGDVVGQPTDAPSGPWRLHSDAVLVGVGAIGQAALWALSHSPLRGRLHAVDMEVVELSNLQRYVLTQRTDEGRSKVEIAAELESSIEVVPHPEELAKFLTTRGYCWDAMLLALDNAADRVSAQASLPRFVANAWTQPGDLGVASHSPFGDEGGCVSCFYLPDGAMKNEDELVAETLGVPQLLMQVRTMLATGVGVDRGFLEAVAQAGGHPIEALAPFGGRTIRELYVEGFCGGAVIPVSQAGQLTRGAQQEVHVPLAHQSALAGVLLAAALVRWAVVGPEVMTQVTRLDVLKPTGQFFKQPFRAARDGRCICDDADFVAAYSAKYT